MKPIELKTPPEQTQTITRVIFGILKEHGPLTISDTWDRVKKLERGLPKLKTHENSPEMDEGEAEAEAHMQSRAATPIFIQLGFTNPHPGPRPEWANHSRSC
ncbi:hypothetical protein Leryth_027251 [Lithospermum erythrorhizon]|nr:hypothetical protein Leryth_027251 [Lithospermum erythrorhizon]